MTALLKEGLHANVVKPFIVPTFYHGCVGKTIALHSTSPPMPRIRVNADLERSQKLDCMKFFTRASASTVTQNSSNRNLVTAPTRIYELEPVNQALTRYSTKMGTFDHQPTFEPVSRVITRERVIA